MPFVTIQPEMLATAGNLWAVGAAMRTQDGAACTHDGMRSFCTTDQASRLLSTCPSPPRRPMPMYIRGEAANTISIG